ncbi:MAG: UDP-2,3-diacylglucosamine diphosphatase, partial [Bacteroidota bacterium]
IKPSNLILNGDIIDNWQFRQKNFPKDHLAVIQQIMLMSVAGTRVYYITGNHDDTLHQLSGLSSETVKLRNQLVLQLGNKKCWVFHGDMIGATIRPSRWLKKMGSKGYEWLISANRLMNKTRALFGRQRKSFSQSLKASVRHAARHIHAFEQTAVDMALSQQYDYVICGHIHIPQIKQIQTDAGHVTYLNSGDWVENLTALEYNFGKWSIYQYDELDYNVQSPLLRVKEKTRSAGPAISTEDILQNFAQRMSDNSQSAA